MQLLLNGENVSITIENERTIGDVLASMNRWLRDNNLAVDRIAVDDIEIPPQDVGKLNDVPIESTARLAIEAFPESEQTTSEQITAAERSEAIIETAITAISELLPSLTQHSILLQTGKHSEAMKILELFCDQFSLALRALPNLTRGDSTAIRLAIEEMTPFLHELAGAFETGDSVLIGDLLEYEICPKTEALISLLRSGDR